MGGALPPSRTDGSWRLSRQLPSPAQQQHAASLCHASCARSAGGQRGGGHERLRQRLHHVVQLPPLGLLLELLQRQLGLLLCVLQQRDVLLRLRRRRV